MEYGKFPQEIWEDEDRWAEDKKEKEYKEESKDREESGELGKKKPVPEYAFGKYSNYQRQQTNKYNKENYKTITVRFRDDGTRELIQAAAKMKGVSLNNFCENLLLKEAYKILMEKKGQE